MAQHKVSKKGKKTSLPAKKVSNAAVRKKKAGSRGGSSSQAHKGNNMSTSKAAGKADKQRVDTAISKMINRKNEEAIRARAQTDMRAGKSA